MPPRGYRHPSPEERILAKTVVHPLGCWEFTGTLNCRGYGVIAIERKKHKTHRVMYEVWFGPIPDGLTIDHLCLNKRCVFPGHLEVVTRSENVRRQHAAGLGKRAPIEVVQAAAALARAAQTHCVHGHSLHDAYTSPSDHGRRRCRTCANAKWRKRYHRKNQS